MPAPAALESLDSSFVRLRRRTHIRSAPVFRSRKQSRTARDEPRNMRCLVQPTFEQLLNKVSGSTRLAIAEDVQLITYRLSRAAMQSRAPMGLRLPQRWHHVIGEMAEG